MKDKRFIELLNLYVDHQLSPQEARDLEAELHANPVRRQTYLDYCRMQKACVQLFENERAAAPESPALARALAEANRKITQHPFAHTRSAAAASSRSSGASAWLRGLFIGGSLATAAACGAIAFFVFKANRAQQPPAGLPVVAAAPAAAVPAAAALPQNETVVMLADVPALTPVASGNIDLKVLVKRFRMPAVTGITQEPAPIAAAETTLLADESVFAWTKELQLRSIRKVSIDEAIANLRLLEQQPQEINTSILRVPATSLQPATERTAIEFKK